jgi:hypothetical protein
LTQVVEPMHAPGAAAELARRLRASQKQLAENCDFAAVEVEGFSEPVPELGHAVVHGVRGPCQAFFFQTPQRLGNGILVQVRHRVAIGFLIASVKQSV